MKIGTKKPVGAGITVFSGAPTVPSAAGQDRAPRIADPVGGRVRLPAGARTIPALEWEPHLSRSETSEETRADSAVSGHGALDARSADLLCEVIFSVSRSGLVVYAACEPVFRSGAPHAAIILDRGDTKTREVVGRRLLKLLQTTGLYMDGLEVFPVPDGRKLGDDDCVVVIATWESRSALIRSVRSLLDGDATMQRALFRTAESARRRKYDATAIKTFRQKGSGLRRQLFGPFFRRWRFSEFSVTEKLAYAGVRLIFDFDDYDLLEQAERSLQHRVRRVGPAQHVRSTDVFDTDRLGDHTEMMQPRLQMFIRWNTDAARSEVAMLLHEICGTKPDEGRGQIPGRPGNRSSKHYGAASN